jgi:hypothetical protein
MPTRLTSKVAKPTPMLLHQSTNPLFWVPADPGVRHRCPHTGEGQLKPVAFLPPQNSCTRLPVDTFFPELFRRSCDVSSSLVECACSQASELALPITWARAGGARRGVCESKGRASNTTQHQHHPPTTMASVITPIAFWFHGRITAEDATGAFPRSRWGKVHVVCRPLVFFSPAPPRFHHAPAPQRARSVSSLDPEADPSQQGIVFGPRGACFYRQPAVRLLPLRGHTAWGALPSFTTAHLAGFCGLEVGGPGRGHRTGPDP